MNVGPAGSIQFAFALPHVLLEVTIEDSEPVFTAYAERRRVGAELLDVSTNTLDDLMKRLDVIAGAA